MFDCETCRGQMLEYLYDLLDGADRQTLEAHLKDCPACQAALVQAKSQQKLLAAAAKNEYPHFHFTPPRAETVSPQPAVLPIQRPRRTARPLRWIAAAAVLLLTLGSAVSALHYRHDYHQAEETVSLALKHIEEAQNNRLQAEKQLACLPQQKQERIAAILKARSETQLQVEVQGPSSIRVGAPTDYQICTRDLNRQLTPAEVSVEVKDNGRTLAKPLPVASIASGVNRVTLPPDLQVRPDSHPTLVVSARRDNGSQVELKEEMQLATPVYVTHLEIDKPMYQLGETVYFRSLTLERFSLKPAQQDLNLQFSLAQPGPGNPERFLIQGRTPPVEERPAGLHPVIGPDGKPLRGVGAGSFKIDENEAGGEYTLIVREAGQRFPEQRRKFLVNKYEKPKLNKELDFSRKSYGPGDEVVARCKAAHLDGRPLKNCRVEVTVVIDNRQYGAQGEERAEPFTFQTDEAGLVHVRFRLPKDIERGLGTVAIKYDDRAMPDSMVRPLPIVLKKLDIEFCPEGGDLVAGLSNRVYFQVRNTLGKPADLHGQLLEDGKPIGVAVATLTDETTPELNQGMGRFEFSPKAGHKYELKVESPVGVAKLHELPPIKPDGVLLSIASGVVKAGDDIPVTVRSTSKRSFLIGAYCRGRLLDSTEVSTIHFAGNEARAVLHPTSGAGGVCRVTVFETLPGDSARQVLRPVAERLIYRQPAERVQVTLKPDQKTYVPRQTVKLGVEATTEKGEPAPAVMLLRVVDKSVVTLADDKTLRTMPAHFLLTTEVRRPEELEYADFLLGPHSRAAEALDLLLGTQGWRRFAEQDPAKFRQEQKEDAERLLVAIGQSQPQQTDLTQQELERVESETARQTEALTAQVAQTKAEVQKAQDDADYNSALVKLKQYDDFFELLRLAGALALTVLLVVATLAFLIVAVLRQVRRALPYYTATAACAMLVVLLAKFSWQAIANRPVRENQFAKVDTTREWHEKARPQATRANHPEPERAEMMVQDAANMPGFGGGAKPGMAPPGPQLGMAQVNEEGKAGFAPHLRLRGAMNGAQPEQPNLDKDYKLNKQLNQKEARLQELGMEKRDRALAKKEPLMQDGKAQAFGLPMAPRVIGGGRRMLAGGGGFAQDKRMEAASRPAPVMPVRVFAHSRASGPSEERYDFAETLFWHPVLVLPGGKTEISFDLCDSLSAFEVTAFAHTLDGRLGSSTETLTSCLPFTVQPRLPLEVTAGDQIDVPLAITNNTIAECTAQITVAEHVNLSLAGREDTGSVSVPANAGIRKLYRFTPTIQEGTANLAFTGKADGFPADSVRANFRVVPEGFPIVGSHSDVLEKSATAELVLPQRWIKDTLNCQVQLYPSTLADLQQGLEALLREPNGCFEQTSTSNYPNILILQYLKESEQSKPAVERRAHELIDRGYQKLISFECLNTNEHKKEGYEWFGGTAPAHEALTAYGLMEFRDMAHVHEVDSAMLQRTRDYLLHQRDGRGGFKRNPAAIDSFGRAPQNITNAYIVWALTEGGKDDDIAKELNALSEQAATSNDPYFLSLVANSLINRAKTAEATKLLNKVSELQKADGHLDAKQTSITGSGGRDLQIETTALAVLGWLKANPGAFNGSVQKAIRWLGQQRGGYGGFGSTQSTILALKALILYTKANKKTPEAGELHLFVSGKQIAASPFAAGTTEPLTVSVPNAETILKPGKNNVRVEITGKNVFPYTLNWSYRTQQPVSAGNCLVKLTTKLDRTEAHESETLRLNVHVENASGKGQGMTVAILGLPGGLVIPEDMKQLKDYTRLPKDGERPLVSAFEIRGRELVLYWRDLAPDQKIEVPIDLICRVPGEYSGPASRAYLYYNADLKHWVEPLKVRIAAKVE